MPKMKTKKAAAKRYSLTATGIVKITRTKRRHNTGFRSSKSLLNSRGPSYITNKGETRTIERALPYGSLK